VPGNVDKQGWEAIFDGLPVETTQTTRTVDFGEIQVTGLSLADSFDLHCHLDARSAFQIILGHGPDFALGDLQADLLLAGHTHGGQVQLPLVGPLITLSRVPRAWASGRTELPGNRTLIVSRGVGLERDIAPRLRFLCRPELVVIDIRPDDKRPGKSLKDRAPTGQHMANAGR
jgi:predicted MPP superfamily phosphohydrolase